MKYVIAKASEFADGARRIVDINGRSVGVFRVGERFFALLNQCPHQFGPLCVGALAPRAVAERPGEITVEDGVPLLACPWHGWEYDLETGQSFMGPGLGNAAVRRYGVEILRGNRIASQVEVEPDDLGRIPGPYKAETFPVSVEEEYVVVDDSPVQRPNRGLGGRVARPSQT